MKKNWIIVVVVAFVVLLVGYVLWSAINVDPPVPPAPEENCEVPDILYMCGDRVIEQRNGSDVKNKLLLAAEHDLEVLNQRGELSNLAEIEQFYQSNSNQRYCVSQSFYQAYKSRRNAICTYFLVIRDSTMSKPTRMEAERELLKSILELRSIPVNGDEVDTTTVDSNKVLVEIQQLKSQKKDLSESAAQVSSEDQPVAEALVENFERVIEFMENDYRRLQEGEISEEYFFQRFKELKNNAEEYQEELKQLRTGLQ